MSLSPDEILDSFLETLKSRGTTLYPAQEEAILALYGQQNVILNTPTGSGKSLVAEALHLLAFRQGRRSIYTSPIKALANEKFLALCSQFGPENVGMITGDASVNPGAPIIACTAEILAIEALRCGENSEFLDIIMDEFHYYSDPERGVAWQLPLLTMSKSRFLLLSATLGETEFFEKKLTELNGLETLLVRSEDRPVPLQFDYSEYPLTEKIQALIREQRAPIYLVNFTQRDAASSAQDLMSIDFCTKEEKAKIADAIRDTKFSSPYGKEFQRILRHGIGIHHAGLLPKYRLLVEKLAQRGLLKIISGTDTLGVGVNVPIRSVLFTQLCKFDGTKTALLKVRDFKQIAGRAGRKGFDSQGYVVAQAPEHVIENLRLEQKGKKFVKKKPPEKGFVPWTLETFRKLQSSQPEPLVSRFRITHAMILQALSDGPAGFRRLKRMIRRSHEGPTRRRAILRQGFALTRALVERGILSLSPTIQVHADLQEDFSLLHALSLFAIDTTQKLDPEAPDYALDVLTLIESICENPDAILRRQVDRAKTILMRELKEQGMDFDARIEELDRVEHPKPRADFVYEHFNEFARKHPWLEQDSIHPKSIAREMFENFYSFADYIREYDLERSEGVLLRYLSEVEKALSQTVPDSFKNDELFEIEAFLLTQVREIDSSLLDEWNRLQGLDPRSKEEENQADPKSTPMRSDPMSRPILARIRNEVFSWIRLFSQKNAAEFSVRSIERAIPQGKTWLPPELDAVMKSYFENHSRLRTDTSARAPVHCTIQHQGGSEYSVQQILVDSEEHNDWQFKFRIRLGQVPSEDQVEILEIIDTANSL